MSDSSYWQRNMAAPGLNRRAFLSSAAVTGAGTAAFLAGCRGSGPAKPGSGTDAGPATVATQLYVVPEAKRGGVMIHVGSDPTTGWDTHATIATTTGNATDQMHLKLIRHDYRKNWKSGADDRIMGEAAEKWEQPDPLTFNFTMRKGLNWPNIEPMNGRPVTAQDVKYAFDHLKLPTSQIQEYVANNIKSVAVIDDNTAQFKLNYPHWRWAMDLDSYNTVVMPKGVYEWGDQKAPDKVRGGGPWLPDEYRPGSLIIFKPNEAYRKVFGIPYADRLNFTILAAGGPTLQAFIAKQSQIFGPAAGELAVAQKGRPDAKQLLTEFAPTRTQALFMKTTEKPWDDVRMRRALSMSVDRDGWGKTLQYEYKLESGPITWGYPDWKLAPEKMPADVNKWLKFDPAEATKLVQAAGVSASTSFEMHMYPYNSGYTPESQFLISSMAKIGVTSKLKVYEYNNWLANAYIGNYSGLLYGPDNLDRITQQLADRLLANSSRNHSEVKDAETQKLLGEFASAKGPEDGKVAAEKIQLRSVDQAYAVYSPQPVSPTLWDPALQNYDGTKPLSYQTSYRTAYMWLA